MKGLASLVRTYPQWLIAVASLAFYLASINGEMTPMTDSACYVHLADAISSFQGYRSVWLAGHPHHTVAPFGFPLLLAPFAGLFGLKLWVLKIPVAVAAALSLPILYRLMESRFDRRIALAVVSFTAIHPQYGIYAHSLLSEAPFLLLSALCIMAVERYKRCDRALDVWAAAAVATFGAAFLTRTIGMALAPAGIMALARGRYGRVKAAMYAAGCAAFVGGWRAWLDSVRLPGDLRYDAVLVKDAIHGLKPMVLTLWDRSFESVIEYTRHTATMVVNHHYLVPLPGTAAILTGAVIFGFVLVSRKRLHTAELYAVAYGAILLAWPFTAARFLVPLLPFILAYFIVFLSRLTRPLRANARAFVFAAVGIAIGGSSLFSTVRHNLLKEHQHPYFRDEWQDFERMNAWIRGHVDADQVLLSRYDPLVFHWTGRLVVPIQAGAPHAVVRSAFDRFRPRFVYVDPFPGEPESKEAFVALLRLDPGRFRLANREGAASLYEVREDAVKRP